MIKDRVRAKIVIPIPFRVLLSPAQHQILSAFSRLEESHRFLYLRPEIVEVPHSASATDLLTARDLLMPVGRGVGILMDLLDLNQAVLAVDKVMLGCEVRSEINYTYIQIDQALSSLRKKAGNRSTYALALPDHAAIKRAVDLGFSEVGGDQLKAALKKSQTKRFHTP